MTMKRAALAVAALLLPGLAACAAPPPTITAVPATADANQLPTQDPNAEALTLTLANTQITVGLERLSFEITDAQGDPIPSSSTVDVEMLRREQLGENETLRQPTASGTALHFGDELPGGGAWVVYHDFDASGSWSVDATVTLPDGRTGSGQANFDVQGRVQTPKVGDKPPAVTTAKLGDAVDIKSLTSDPSPVEAFYWLSLDEAIDDGKPTVVVFGSPGSCSDCATVLDEAKAVLATWGSQVDFVHVESSDVGDPNRVSPAAAAWGVPADVPWTFVLNAQGYVEGRVEGPIGRTELELLVKRALGQ